MPARMSSLFTRFRLQPNKVVRPNGRLHVIVLDHARLAMALTCDRATLPARAIRRMHVFPTRHICVMLAEEHTK